MNEVYVNSLVSHGVRVISDSGNLVTIDHNLFSELRKLQVNHKLFANFIDGLTEEKFPGFFWVGSAEEENNCKDYELLISNLYAFGESHQYFFLLGKDLLIAFKHHMSENAEEFLLKNAGKCNRVRMPFLIRFFPLELMQVASRLDEGTTRNESGTLEFLGNKFNILWPLDAEEVMVNVKS